MRRLEETKQALVADGPYSISPDQPEMTLTVTLTDTAVTLGSVQLEFEREAPMGRAQSAEAGAALTVL